MRGGGGWLFLAFLLLVAALGPAFWLAWKLRVTTAGRPLAWLRAWLGWGRGVGELARRLGVDAQVLRTGRPVYRPVSIPKRRGGGERLLAVPDDATKEVQRRILRRLLARLRVHPAVHGFERGRSIVTNARPHEGKDLVLKLDIRGFFPATQASRVERYFRRIGWSAQAAALLTRWCTHEGGLPQGAPTSPRLSNLVNYGLDVSLCALARRCRADYTRYADDLTFSMRWQRTRRPGVLARGLVQKVQRRLGPFGYRLHPDKTRWLRRHQQQRVTGLVVNQVAALPRRTRRWLRAVEHRARTGGAPTLSPAQREGWRALAAMVQAGPRAAPPAAPGAPRRRSRGGRRSPRSRPR